jgi:hypothetical protein
MPGLSYDYRMNKQAVSVTLTPENLLWLEAQVIARRSRSVSAMLDQILSEARASSPARSRRSVAGTIEINAADPDLLRADAAVRGLFRPALARTANNSRRVAGRRRG